MSERVSAATSSRATRRPEESGPDGQVYEAQRALNRAFGMNRVPEDGRWSPATETAVRDYQRSHDLPETGRLDVRTLDSLLRREGRPLESAIRGRAVEAREQAARESSERRDAIVTPRW